VAKSAGSFKPGAEWTGNKNGRPPAGESPTALLRAALAEEHAPGVSRLRFLVQSAVASLVRRAERGELTPGDLAWLTTRLDGAPPPSPEAQIRQNELDQARAVASALAALRANGANGR
jgi:hypothetical protein